MSIKRISKFILFGVITLLVFLGCSNNELTMTMTENITPAIEESNDNIIKDVSESDNQQKLKNTTLEVEDVNLFEEIIKIHFIDVGQGDAILIQQDNYNMLIDAGDNQYGQLVVNYLKQNGVTKLDYVIGTHPHADHIGGLDDVINTFDVGKILMPKVTHTTRTFEDVITAIKNKNLKITTPKVGDTYSLGYAQWTILAPHKEKYDNLNDYSIVVKLEFGENSFIFTGDAEKQSESEMVGNNKISLKSDVLKVSHHGSNSSSTNAFLDAVNPQYAVIQVGADNRYGHPHQEVLERLQKRNIEIYRNDLHGTIIATSDGKNIKFETERKSQQANAPPIIADDLEDAIYIGNKNSQIFHIDTCSSLPAEHNRVYFKSKEDAIELGYIACRRCKP